MTVLEETVKNPVAGISKPAKFRESLLSRFIGLLCSVRFGVVLLILLGALCLVGMFVTQQNVEGFARYYATLTPFKKNFYGRLDLFNIYQAWYFNALLALLSLNIILASADRFPASWRYLKNPKKTVPGRWLKTQKGSAEIVLKAKTKAEIVQKVTGSLKKHGFKKTQVTEKNGRTFIFAQTGAWNRLGAYAVHIALLTIFFGSFLSARLAENGQLPLAPGQTSSQIYETVVRLDEVNQIMKALPFEIVCTDIEQKLIRPEGALETENTLDQITRFQIRDGAQTVAGEVRLNQPFDYRGYRFFQGNALLTGRARRIVLQVQNAESREIRELTLERNGRAELPDGTEIRFTDFRANFSFGAENKAENARHYPYPAAILQIIKRGENSQTAYAFSEKMNDLALAERAVGGYKFKLLDFEKVGERHLLAVQYDPGTRVMYVGFTSLFITLVFVLFFSHQRIWAMVEKNSEMRFTVTLGGQTNRHQQALEEKLVRLFEKMRDKNL